MNWQEWLSSVQRIAWDEASIAQNAPLASKLNDDVLRAAEARLGMEDEPSTFVRALRELGGLHD